MIRRKTNQLTNQDRRGIAREVGDELISNISQLTPTYWHSSKNLHLFALFGYWMQPIGRADRDGLGERKLRVYVLMVRFDDDDQEDDENEIRKIWLDWDY